jgi:hypothetical protein
MVLPPFFRFTRGAQLNLVYCPWPFFQKMRGERERLYLWPLWGRDIRPGVQRGFLLWPLVWTWRVDRGDTVRHRLVVMPFLQHEADMRRGSGDDEAAACEARYFKLWPLLSYRREGDRRRFRTLALWPLKESGPVERSYAPLWTLFSHTAVGEAADTEFLWGCYRRCRRGPDYRSFSLFPLVSSLRDEGAADRREWSVLKGLVGYERRGAQKRWRLLYFLRFGPDETDP